ncbi:MAG: HlyC/CorC family transporter [Acidobacteria bacterium]|nr:HlyC/CorC family transporter [Acidobacteriota bacterium]
MTIAIMEFSLKFGTILFLLLANGFFVAVEFALVSVRRARIETLAAAGRRGAPAVLRALDHLDAMLSASQFGITLASLALGAVGESTLASWLEPLLRQYLPAASTELVSHSISIGISLAVITYLHLVLGEYAPKALAIEKAESIALATARWMEIFYRTFKPFIEFINLSGIRLLRLIGVEFRPGHHTAYSEDEIRYLINVSHQSGLLEKDEKELIQNVFVFSELTVGEIMVPRTKVVAIEERAGFAEVVDQLRSSGYSRLPVYGENVDNIVGVIHSKDLMPFLLQPDNFDLRQLMRKAHFLPETARLAEALQQLQRSSVHLAIIVDEHGGMEGILTMEDLLEEIVGEIKDEHDEVEAVRDRSPGERVFIIDAGLAVREVNRDYPVDLPESDEYTTVAGFLLKQAGRLLGVGDVVEFEGIRFIVERVERRRLLEVRVELPGDEVQVPV